MVIERKEIKLVGLTEEYIELLRQNRNLPEVQNTMEYRDHITPEMQKKWFDNIDIINDHYFLINCDDTFIGLISATDIDWEARIVNNGGIFIWEKKYLRSSEIVQASVLLTDFGFYIGINKNYIRILKDNEQAIIFNKALGYTLLPEQDNVYNQKYELTPDVYFRSTEIIRRQNWFNRNIKLYATKSEYGSVLRFANMNRSGQSYFNFDVELNIT